MAQLNEIVELKRIFLRKFVGAVREQPHRMRISIYFSQDMRAGTSSLFSRGFALVFVAPCTLNAENERNTI